MRYIVTFYTQNKIVHLSTDSDPWAFADQLTLKYNLPILDSDILVFTDTNGDGFSDSAALLHRSCKDSSNCTFHTEEAALASAVAWPA